MLSYTSLRCDCCPEMRIDFNHLDFDEEWWVLSRTGADAYRDGIERENC
jgi:hypothetical protein